MARVDIQEPTMSPHRPARVTIHKAPGAAIGPGTLQPGFTPTGQEGQSIELGDAMKTRVQHHGSSGPIGLIGADPMRTRVTMGEPPATAIGSVDVQNRSDPSLKAPPAEPLSPAEVVEQLEKKAAALSAQASAIAVEIAQIEQALVYARKRAASEPTPESGVVGESDDPGALLSFDGYTIAEALPIIIGEDDPEILAAWLEAEANGSDRVGINEAIEHKLGEIAESAEEVDGNGTDDQDWGD